MSSDGSNWSGLGFLVARGRYVYTYISVYMHTYIHTCVHTCIYTYISIRMNAQTHRERLTARKCASTGPLFTAFRNAQIPFIHSYISFSLHSKIMVGYGRLGVSTVLKTEGERKGDDRFLLIRESTDRSIDRSIFDFYFVHKNFVFVSDD